MRRTGDIVPNVDESTLREMYGADADEVVAFRRFLRLPRDADGKVLCSQHWHDYATGRIDSKTAIELDDKERGNELQGDDQEGERAAAVADSLERSERRDSHDERRLLLEVEREARGPKDVPGH